MSIENTSRFHGIDDAALITELNRLRRLSSALRDGPAAARVLSGLSLSERFNEEARKSASLAIKSFGFELLAEPKSIGWVLKCMRGAHALQSAMLLSSSIASAIAGLVDLHTLDIRAELRFREHRAFVNSIAMDWNDVLEHDKYITLKGLREWRASQRRRIREFTRTHGATPKTERRFQELRALLASTLNKGNLEQHRQQHNVKWSRRERARYPHIFEERPELGQGPLTDGQLLIATSSEQNVLGLAAAGTGKTSVVLRKVEYHVTKGELRSEDTLLLSFSNAAVDELSERFNKS